MRQVVSAGLVATIFVFCSQALGAAVPSGILYPSFASRSGTLTSFSVKGSSLTETAGINGNGVVVGIYGTRTATRAFTRNASGQISTFKVPDIKRLKNVYARCINDSGLIAGIFDRAVEFPAARGFVRSATGEITVFNLPQNNGGDVFAINGKGDVVGNYFDESGGTASQPGFLRTADGTITTIVPSGDTVPAAINDKGVIAGSMANADGFLIGFVRAVGGTVTTFSLGATQTNPLAINASGTIVGSYLDKKGRVQGFIRDSKGNLTHIRIAGAVQVMPGGLNRKGDIAGIYQGNHQSFHFFELMSDGKLTTVPLKATLAVVTGIDGNDVSTGWYNALDGDSLGFVYKP
jgi:hypothetical protein